MTKMSLMRRKIFHERFQSHDAEKSNPFSRLCFTSFTMAEKEHQSSDEWHMDWTQSLGEGGSMFTTILNKLGLVSSYEEILRYQHDMGALSAIKQNDRALIPSHFQTNQFTSGFFDNWDHKGERVSVLDTVAVLYQDSSSVTTSKPNISESSVEHGRRAFDTKLKCQQRLEFFKPANQPDFPSEVTIEPSIIEQIKDKSYLLKVNMAWNLS